MRQALDPIIAVFGQRQDSAALLSSAPVAAMGKAEARVCTGSDRCYPLPSDVDTARARCTSKGRCRVGLVVGRGGRESFDVWLEVSTGLVKLIRQAET